ncbi:ABC transporter domain-containing protein, partial [Haematococcus lacustris]
VVIFNRGRIEQQGSPNDIIKKPATPFIMKFVGETNQVPATAQLLRRVGFHTGKAWAMFRPSDMQISKTCSDKGAAAVVVERTNLGWTLKYLLRFDDDVEVEYSVARDQDERQYNFSIGQRIFVYVPPECIMGFEMHEIESAPLH